MSPATYDVVIVGAGIVGAACAAECAGAGMRVGVVEQNFVGCGATAAGMGHIVVMDDSEAQFALTRYSQQLWRELACELPKAVEYESCGTIWVAADEEEMDAVRSKHAFYSARGVPVEVLDGAQVAAAEPNLRPGLAGGLLVPQDGVLYPPAAARFLLDTAKQRGAALHTGIVTQLTGTAVTLAGGSTLSAGTTVNATGSWAPELTPGIEVRKRKGHLVITDRYPGFLRHQLVELGYLKSAHSVTSDSVAFNVQPRITGQILIGSSRQYGAEDPVAERKMLTAMLERAFLYMPQLARLSTIRCWTGFRAATPDKLPLIGPCSAEPGLLLATGHEGLGITTSLATAKLIADQLLGRRSQIALEPYLPARAEQGVAHV